MLYTSYAKAGVEGRGEEATVESGKEAFIYLDHNATTPLDPAVVTAMLPMMEREFGNPSSLYPLGERAKERLEEARTAVASVLGCSSAEIVFTSGGTESNNTVLKGVIDFRRPEAFHIVTTTVEHPAIMNPALHLRELGVRISFLPVDSFGRVNPADVARAIEPATVLVTVMLANNETGVLQPIREISAITRERGVLLHTDAAQAVGKLPLDVNELGVDFLSVAGHKVYAPKGVGALYLKKGHRLTPLMHGAGQEGGRRPGTENTMLAVGLGAASRVVNTNLRQDIREMAGLRDRLQELLTDAIGDAVVHGRSVDRLPNTLSISVPGVEGREILAGTPTLYASTGAACHGSDVRLSHVLAAMGVPPDVGMGTLRLTVGRSNTKSQIEAAAEKISARVRELRG
jgi:cysteine desulfurase